MWSTYTLLGAGKQFIIIRHAISCLGRIFQVNEGEEFICSTKQIQKQGETATKHAAFYLGVADST